MSVIVFEALVTAIMGLTVGSFMNVVIWRVPRGESVVSPGSHCPNCNSAVKAYDNIPVLGWLLLGGKCRSCQRRISMRYPVVEMLTGVLLTIVAVSQRSLHTFVLDELLVLTLVPVALIDFDHRIIPNKILGPAAIAAIAAGAATHPAGLLAQLVAGAAAAGFLFAFAISYPQGMGMGDVKLAGVLGLFLGRSVAVAILAAVILGLLFGVGVMLQRGGDQGRKTAIPFGPFLALGALIAVFCGDPIVHWYLHTVI